MCRGWQAAWDEEMEIKVFSLRAQKDDWNQIHTQISCLFWPDRGLRAELRLGKDLPGVCPS